ncbi:MAG: hypothetical protein Q9198_004646 [Flavoplaca austrocitrina]
MALDPLKKSKIPEDDNRTAHYGPSKHRVNEPLLGSTQSKLSQDELAQLMKSTHFDKKELQQWYKGTGENTSQLKLLEADANATS